MKLKSFVSLIPFINDTRGSRGGEFFIDNRPRLSLSAYFFPAWDKSEGGNKIKVSELVHSLILISIYRRSFHQCTRFFVFFLVICDRRLNAGCSMQGHGSSEDRPESFGESAGRKLPVEVGTSQRGESGHLEKDR